MQAKKDSFEPLHQSSLAFLKPVVNHNSEFQAVEFVLHLYRIVQLFSSGHQIVKMDKLDALHMKDNHPFSYDSLSYFLFHSYTYQMILTSCVNEHDFLLISLVLLLSDERQPDLLLVV